MRSRAVVTPVAVTFALLLGYLCGPRGKMQFARVLLQRAPDGWQATPTGPRGSNLISTIARANGLAMVPPGIEVAPAGSQVRVQVFRSAED